VLVCSPFRRIGGFVVVSLLLALVAAPNASAALASDYAPTAVSMPPQAGDANGSYLFGSPIVNAAAPGNPNLLLVGAPGANNGEGAIVIVNPGDGGTQRIDRPLEPSHVGNPTRFGASVAVIPDIGKCVSAASPGAACTASPTRDGVPDFVVGAPGADIRDGTGVDMGIVYVYDGASRAFMKRIQIGPKPASASDPVDGAPLDGTPGFGAAVSSASAMPPCAGSGGIGGCAALGSRLAQGDVDGDGTPDLVIGAPSFQENQDSNPLACGTTASCEPTGKVYVVSGSAITASGGALATSAPDSLVFGGPIGYSYPAESSDPPNFGGAAAPLGDVGSCDTTGLGFGVVTCPLDHVHNAPDGVPDLLVSATGADSGGGTDAGAAFVVDGASAIVLSRLDGASGNARFGSFSSGESAFGDLVDTGLPDVYVGAQGLAKGYVFTGDGTLPQASRLWAETPVGGTGFGVSSAPAGDVGGDAPGEVLIGEAGAVSAVHVFSACANAIVQTIPAPAGSGGFGAAVAPAGDVNGDGYADFAVGAPSTASNAGRVYVMKSSGTPGPGVIPCHPGGGGDTGGDTGGGAGSGTAAGGGAGTTTTTPSKRTRALAVRRISLSTNKKKVKAGAPIKLSGIVRASKKKGQCQIKQKVAIQRQALPGVAWATIDVAVTTKKGRFLSTTTPAPANTKFYYRARLNRTKRCGAAKSNKVKVKATL
jgi:FG-GAP repeat